MELLFDIGNTHTVIGIDKGNHNYNTWRIGTHSIETEDYLFSMLTNLLSFNNINLKDISAVGVCSVVPSVNYIIEKFSHKYFNLNPIFLKSAPVIGDIKNLADYYEEVGPDRLANVIAAKKLYGDNVITLDFGTAITLDILEDGNFVGGAIIPGFKTSMMALFSNTARLPQVELIVPKSNIGKNTVDNIQIGIIKTTVFGIERLIEEIMNETGKKYTILCTGGMAKFLKGTSFIFDNYDSDLTLKGIQYYMSL